MLHTTVSQKPNTVKPSTRLWLLGYPAGAEGQRRAILAGLELELPQVVDEVRAIIFNTRQLDQAEAIAERAIRAAFIVKDGKVWPARDPKWDASYINEIARVKGSREEAYVISFDGQEAHCDCHDYQLGNAPALPSGQLACKHILAVLITEALKEDEPEF